MERKRSGEWQSILDDINEKKDIDWALHRACYGTLGCESIDDCEDFEKCFMEWKKRGGRFQLSV